MVIFFQKKTLEKSRFVSVERRNVQFGLAIGLASPLRNETWKRPEFAHSVREAVWAALDGRVRKYDVQVDSVSWNGGGPGSSRALFFPRVFVQLTFR